MDLLIGIILEALAHTLFVLGTRLMSLTFQNHSSFPCKSSPRQSEVQLHMSPILSKMLLSSLVYTPPLVINKHQIEVMLHPMGFKKLLYGIPNVVTISNATINFQFWASMCSNPNFSDHWLQTGTSLNK